jgi:peptidyl-prolyl cis-trans isomerase SurA
MKRLQKAKILKFTINRLLIIGGLFLANGLTGQDNPGFLVDKIIVKVDNYIVLKSELEGTYQSYLADGNIASEDAKCGLLNRLIVNKLMVAKAEIDSVVVTDESVDQNTTRRMQLILQNSGNSPEELERAYGKTMDEIKLDLRDQVREQMLGSEMTTKITKGIAITPAEVRRFFNKIPSDSLPFYSSDVEIAQIVKIAEVSQIQKDQTRQRLIEIRDRILKGEDFNKLAREFSEDPSAQYNGGEMGYVGRGAMVPSFEATAFKLRKGETSMPFESPFGFHIMQLLDRRGNEYNSRHILIAAMPSADDITRTEKFMDSLRMQIVKDSISFLKAAKEYSDDQETNGQGGFFTDDDGGTKVSIKEIDPIVYFTIDTMKVGQISRPIKYRTDDGKDAVRILFFKTKLPPHQANLKDDWHRIHAAALAEKKDIALDKWFRKARKDVFISIDPEYNNCGLLE